MPDFVTRLKKKIPKRSKKEAPGSDQTGNASRDVTPSRPLYAQATPTSNSITRTPASSDLKSRGFFSVQTAEDNAQPSKDIVDDPCCWAKAAERLEGEDQAAFKTLEEIKSYVRTTPADLKQLLEDQKYQIDGPNIFVEGAIKSILDFQSFGSAITSFDPTKAAPTVWRGFCSVLETIIRGRALDRDILLTVEKVAARIRHWTEVEHRSLLGTAEHRSEKFPSLEENLINLYTAILRLEVFLYRHCQSGTFASFIKTTSDSNTWDSYTKEINNCHEICDIDYNSCLKKIEQNGKIKDWITEQRSKNEHLTICTKVNIEKYPNCGLWLLETPDFKRWSNGSLPVLWIKGTVGTGKTTLMARIVQWHLDTFHATPEHRFAYCYSSNETGRHTYQDILRILLRQVAYNSIDGKISRTVIAAYRKGSEDKFDSRICQSLLVGILNEGVKIRMVIDALDECDNPRELLNILQDVFEQTTGNLQLLVTSRTRVQVQEKFPHAGVIDLLRAETEADLHTYVTGEIKQRKDDDRLLKGKRPDLEDRLINTLEETANGMFRWAELQLGIFFHPRSPPIHLEETVLDYICKLNKGTVNGQDDLNKAYEEIFNLNTRENTAEREHVLKVYKLLMFSERRDIMFIVDAIRSQQNKKSLEVIQPEYILDLTRDFLGISISRKGTECFHFVHVSAMEYLQQLPSFEESQFHAEIAKLCLEYMMKLNPVIEETVALRQEEYNKERAFDELAHFDKTYVEQLHKWMEAHNLKAPLDSFYLYSFQHWGNHCAQTTRIQRETLGLSKQLLTWMTNDPFPLCFKNWVSFHYHVYGHMKVTPFRLEMLRRRQYLGLDEVELSESESHTTIAYALEVCACFNLDEIAEALFSKHKNWGNEAAIQNHGELFINAALFGNAEMMDLLIRRNKDVINYERKNGITALGYSVLRGHKSIVEKLLDTDVSTEIRNNSFLDLYAVQIVYRSIRSMFCEIVEQDDGYEILKLLLDKGTSPNLYHPSGFVPLSIAKRFEEEEIFQLLLSAGADQSLVRDMDELKAKVFLRHAEMSMIRYRAF